MLKNENKILIPLPPLQVHQQTEEKKVSAWKEQSLTTH